MRFEYEKPELREYGTLTQSTGVQSFGFYFDKNHTVGNPKDKEPNYVTSY